MILINFNQSNFTIDDEFNVNPKNEIIENAVISSLALYNSPSQGFKTSFVANQLEQMNFDILDVYDKEMEDAPEGVVY